MTKRYIKTDYTGCPYITAGKLYGVVGEIDGLFCIVDDRGERATVCVNGARCVYLNCDGRFEWATPEETKEEKMEQNEYKPFGQLSREEKLGLMAAWVDGKEIEFSVNGGSWHEGKTLGWLGHYCYRIKPEPVEMPSIDWSHVHPDYKWLAVDAGGSADLFTDKPYLEGLGDNGFWTHFSAAAAVPADAFTSYKRGNVAWDKSLVKRPEGV